jgi:hypothetical protein
MMRCGFINRPFKAFRAADLPMNAARFSPACGPTGRRNKPLGDHHQRVDRLAPAIKAITVRQLLSQKIASLQPETLTNSCCSDVRMHS